MQRRNAVHSGHTLVHHDDVVFVFFAHSDGFFTAKCRIDIDERILKKSLDHGQVHGSVVNHENARIRCMEGILLCFTSTYAPLEFLPEIAYGLFGYHLLGYYRRKCRTVSVTGLNIYRTAHHLNQASSYRKTQSCTFDSAVLLDIDSFELTKKLILIFILYTYTGIFYGYYKIQFTIIQCLVLLLGH